MKAGVVSKRRRERALRRLLNPDKDEWFPGPNTAFRSTVYTLCFLITTIVYSIFLKRQQKSTRSSCYKMAALYDLLSGAVLAKTALYDDITQKLRRFTLT